MLEKVFWRETLSEGLEDQQKSTEIWNIIFRIYVAEWTEEIGRLGLVVKLDGPGVGVVSIMMG